MTDISDRSFAMSGRFKNRSNDKFVYVWPNGPCCECSSHNSSTPMLSQLDYLYACSEFDQKPFDIWMRMSMKNVPILTVYVLDTDKYDLITFQANGVNIFNMHEVMGRVRCKKCKNPIASKLNYLENVRYLYPSHWSISGAWILNTYI